MHYTIVIYTAGVDIYAQFMRYVLTSWGLDVAVTLSREHCGGKNGKYTKVLKRVQGALWKERQIHVEVKDMVMLENIPQKVEPRGRARTVPNWEPDRGLEDGKVFED